MYTYLHADTACLEKPLQINTQESSKMFLFTEINPLTYLEKYNFAVVAGIAVSQCSSLEWIQLSRIPSQQPNAMAEHRRSYLFIIIISFVCASLSLPSPFPALSSHDPPPLERCPATGPHRPSRAVLWGVMEDPLARPGRLPREHRLLL